MYLDCVTNSLMVWWNHAEGATSYVALADTRGADSVCRTNVTGCHFLDLDCGRVYAVRLLASDGQCNSSLSTSEDVESGERGPAFLPSAHWIRPLTRRFP